MLATTFAMTMARLNEWRINVKPNATAQATPANALAHPRLSSINYQLSTGADFRNSLRNANILGLCKKSQRFFAAFAADTALFHPAEGNAEIAHEPAVYPDRAGVDSLSDTMGAAQVLCPDAGGKAVFDVIGVIDHFFFAVEWCDCYDGAENFFAIGAA